VAVFLCIVCNNNTNTLNIWGFKVFEKSVLVPGRRRYTVISDQRLCEDKYLSAVGGVGHGFGISDEGGCEDGFSRDVGFGTERLAVEDGSILWKKLAKNSWYSSN
jgi:hypothetical protein